MSQIGYMIMGVGVGAYEGGVAHFFTHAFFKAQLFLAAGLIIHALANEQDVRRMGGLIKRLPFAFVAILTGVLSICGTPGFSGFFSKDKVIYGALETGHPWLYAVGILTAGITAYYMFRLLFVTFLGTYRGDVDPSDLGIRHPELAGTPDANAEHETHHHAARVDHGGYRSEFLSCRPIFAGWLMFGGNASPWTKFFSGMFVPVARDRADGLRADRPAVSSSFSCWPDSGSRGCATRPRARKLMPSSGCGPNRCGCPPC